MLGGLGGGEAMWHTATGPANCGHSHKPKDSLHKQTVWKRTLMPIERITVRCTVTRERLLVTLVDKIRN